MFGVLILDQLTLLCASEYWCYSAREPPYFSILFLPFLGLSFSIYIWKYLIRYFPERINLLTMLWFILCSMLCIPKVSGLLLFFHFYSCSHMSGIINVFSGNLFFLPIALICVLKMIRVLKTDSKRLYDDILDICSYLLSN